MGKFANVRHNFPYINTVSQRNMKEDTQAVRQRVIDHVEMLADAGAQLQYEREVPIASVPDELVCGFCDDLFHPKWQPFLDAFTEEELKSLSELYGRLCAAADEFDRDGDFSMQTIQKIPKWREVMAFAKGLATELRQNG
jgi:hypothetical protein